MNRPNIFDYAKKELSQDAMICWLLECCRSGNGAYREIGHDFVRFILDDESIAADEIELDKYSPHGRLRQYSCRQGSNTGYIRG